MQDGQNTGATAIKEDPVRGMSERSQRTSAQANSFLVQPGGK
jgi:hypothetical protein